MLWPPAAHRPSLVRGSNTVLMPHRPRQSTTHRAACWTTRSHNIPGAAPSRALPRLPQREFLLWRCSQWDTVWLSRFMLVKPFPPKHGVPLKLMLYWLQREACSRWLVVRQVCSSEGTYNKNLTLVILFHCACIVLFLSSDTFCCDNNKAGLLRSAPWQSSKTAVPYFICISLNTNIS